MNRNSDNGEKAAFLNGLQQFLNDRGKILFPYPWLAGKIIDLHDLYNKVTSFGGYQKVTDKDLWEDLIPDYKFPVNCSSLIFGLKTTYQRYLEDYERVHYFGDDESAKKPHYDVSVRRTRNPTYVSEHDRAQFGLSTTRLSEPRFAADVSDYERLAFSLTSCLPNEVDFAINACTLLSGESRHVLRLSRCPQILEALLLHAGIVSDCVNSYADVSHEWGKKTQHDLRKFWTDTVSDSFVLSEMLPRHEACETCRSTSDCKSCRSATGRDEAAVAVADPTLTSTGVENGTCCETAGAAGTSVAGVCEEKSCAVLKSCVHDVPGTTQSQPESTDDQHRKWSHLFHSSRSLGVQDYEGQRVLQIALVLLNLSFERFNVTLLARNKSLIQFVFLCIHSNYSSLRQTGLDILGNLSAEMELTKLDLNIMKCTYSTVEKCIQSADKFDQIRGFEILGNLCKWPCNRDSLLVSLDDGIFKIALCILTIGDVELSLAALESLYVLSQLGEETCSRIVLVPGSIDILVCLITFSVRSLKSEQLSSIRIARRIAPPQVQHAPAQVQHVPHPPAPVHRAMPPAAMYQGAHGGHFPSRMHYPMPPAMQPVYHPSNHPPKMPTHALPPRPLVPVHIPSKPVISKPHELGRPAGAGPVYTHKEISSTPPVFHYIPAPPPDIVLDKSPGSFAQLWVWATYEQCEDGSVPRVELFAEYAAAATRYGLCGKNQVLPAAEFGRCLQRVFANTASRLFTDSNSKPMYHITGIKRRQTPLPVPGHHPQLANALANNKINHVLPTAPATSLDQVAKCEANKETNDQRSETQSIAPAAPPELEQNPSVSLAKTQEPVQPESCPPSGTCDATETVTNAAPDETGAVVSAAQCSDAPGQDVAQDEHRQTCAASASDASSRTIPAQPECEIASNGESAQVATEADVAMETDNKIVEPCINAGESVENKPNPCRASPTELTDNTTVGVENDVVMVNGSEPCNDVADKTKIIDEQVVARHCDNDEVVTSINELKQASQKLLQAKLNACVNATKTTTKATEVVCNGTADDDALSDNVAKETGTAPPCDAKKDSAPTSPVHLNGVDTTRDTATTNGNAIDAVAASEPSPQENAADNAHQVTSCSPTTPPNAVKTTMTIASPQTGPLAPNQLRHYFDKKSGSGAAKEDGSMMVNSPDRSASERVTTDTDILCARAAASVAMVPGVKRSHPPSTQATEPPAKVAHVEVPASAPITRARTNCAANTPIKSESPAQPQPHAVTAPTYQHPAHPPVAQRLHPQHSMPTPHARPAHPAPQTPVAAASHHAGPPQNPATPHPGGHRKQPAIDLMAPNASMLVLFRNTAKQTFDDFSDEKEDPISKSIRLTSTLILINISRFSDYGRSTLQRHQSWLAQLAMSGMDCSNHLAKLLGELDR